MNPDEKTSQSSENAYGSHYNSWKNRDYFAWAREPGFNPMKLAAVAAGFAIFPPVGVATLLYFVWKNRRGYGYGHGPRWANPAFAGEAGPRFARGGGCGSGGRHGHYGRGRWTGNRAFDEHQAEVMQTLRTEREAFWSYREEQPQKRDREAYEAFRSSQGSKGVEPGSA